MATVKERPVILSTGTIRDILENRKNQLRLIIKPQPNQRAVAAQRHAAPDESDLWSFWGKLDDEGRALLYEHRVRCPYALGDLLWVKETWGLSWNDHGHQCLCYPLNGTDDPRNIARLARLWNYEIDAWVKRNADAAQEPPDKWQPRSRMPRWASRITLKVTGVRTQRVQDITAEDAEAEGIGFEQTRCDGECGATPCSLAVPRFRDLWDSINARPKSVIGKRDGKRVILRYESYPWNGESHVETYRGLKHHLYANPWVFAITFQRVNDPTGRMR